MIMPARAVPRSLNLASYVLDRHPSSRVALRGPDGDVTYGELRGRVDRCGNALRACGAGRGDRVLLALHDGVDFVATWFAVQKIGAVTAEVAPFLTAAQYRYYLDYVAPAVVVADATSLPGLREAGHHRAVVAGGGAVRLEDGERSLDAMVDAAEPGLRAAPTRSDDVAMWRFTTGSTGAPKACLLPARSAVLSADWYARETLRLGPADTVLSVPKLFFGYGFNMTVLFPLVLGAVGVIDPARWTAASVFAHIERFRPTVLVNVPTMISAMVAHPGAETRDLSSLRVCVSGGEALPAEVRRRWRELFDVDIVDGIGSSEVFHGFICNRVGEVREGSLGRVVPGYRVDVVDERGSPVPDGVVGRLRIVGETAALGYQGAPEQSAATFPAPHTVVSGDLAVRDADGYYFYRGRADDLLKVSGMWVAPTEVEDCLLGHPSVRQCAVVGVPGPGGLTGTHAVVVADGRVSAPELTAHVRAALARHKVPGGVTFVDVLPLTPSGKVDRRAVREAVLRDDAVRSAS